MNDAEKLLNEANDLFVDEKYEQALTLYDQALKIDSQNVKALLKRSITNHKLENYTGNCVCLHCSLVHRVVSFEQMPLPMLALLSNWSRPM
jgi:hypothetical protein